MSAGTLTGLLQDFFKLVHPHRMFIVPGHTRVHPDNQVFVHVETGIAFGLNVSISHIPQPLLNQAGYFKRDTVKDKAFAGITINAISSLLGFPPFERGRDQFWLPYKAINVTGFFWILAHREYRGGQPLRGWRKSSSDERSGRIRQAEQTGDGDTTGANYTHPQDPYQSEPCTPHIRVKEFHVYTLHSSHRPVKLPAFSAGGRCSP